MADATSSAAQQDCDLLVRNAYVITLDEQRHVYPSGAVAITGRRIVAVGPDAEVGLLTPARTIDAGGGAVHPGADRRARAHDPAHDQGRVP